MRIELTKTRAFLLQLLCLLITVSTFVIMIFAMYYYPIFILMIVPAGFAIIMSSFYAGCKLEKAIQDQMWVI